MRGPRSKRRKKKNEPVLEPPRKLIVAATAIGMCVGAAMSRDAAPSSASIGKPRGDVRAVERPAAKAPHSRLR
jgi:hypothetical protein